MSIITTRALRPMRHVLAALAALALSAGIATAQTYGIATMQPGTLSHTSASAIAKVLKEKGGLECRWCSRPPANRRSFRWSTAANPTSASPISSKWRAAAKSSPNLRLIGSLARVARRLLGAQGFADEDHGRSQGQEGR